MARVAAEKPVNIIVGSGALGAFLATDGLLPGPVGLVDVVPLCFPLVVRDAAGERLYRGSEFVATGLEDAARSQFFEGARQIFVCVPPNATEDIVRFLSDIKLPSSAVVFFCGNGLVRNELRIVRRNPSTTLCRALFYAGFLRTVSSRGTLIVHNGGRRVEWGVLQGQRPEPPQTEVLKWSFQANIRQKEKEKFFTNLVLAAVLGADSLPNGAVWSRVSPEKVHELAREFCAMLGEPSELSPPIAASFFETVELTRGNVNSVSLARARGDERPWEALRSQLAALLGDSENKADGARFVNFIVSRRDE